MKFVPLSKDIENNAVGDKWIFIFIYPIMSFMIIHIGNDNSLAKLLTISSYYSDVFLALLCSFGLGIYFKKLHFKVHKKYDWIDSKREVIVKLAIYGLALPVIIILGIEAVYLEFLLNIPLSESAILYLELPILVTFCLVINLLYVLLYFRKSVEDLSGQVLASTPKYEKTSFIIDKGVKSLKINISEIAYFMLIEKNTFLVTVDGEKHLGKWSLEEISKMVLPADFFQLNRQFISHRQSIESYSRTETRKLEVKLSPLPVGSVYISKVKASSFENWISEKVSASIT